MLSKSYHASIYDASMPVPSYWEATAPVDQAGYVPLEGEQSCDDADFPAVMAGLAPRFPFAAIRLWCLRAAYVYYRLQDAR